MSDDTRRRLLLIADGIAKKNHEQAMALNLTDDQKSVVNMMILGGQLCAIAGCDSIDSEMRVCAHKLTSMLDDLIFYVVEHIDAERER